MSWREATGNGEDAQDTAAEAQPDGVRGDPGAAIERLLPGQRVQARVHGVVHWSGTVETVSVPLGVIWIREDGLGERKLLNLQHYQVHPDEPPGGSAE